MLRCLLFIQLLLLHDMHSGPTFSQFLSFKIRRSTFLNYINFVERRIMRLYNCQRLRRVRRLDFRSMVGCGKNMLPRFVNARGRKKEKYSLLHVIMLLLSLSLSPSMVINSRGFEWVANWVQIAGLSKSAERGRKKTFTLKMQSRKENTEESSPFLSIIPKNSIPRINNVINMFFSSPSRYVSYLFFRVHNRRSN